ncbi:MAG: alpha/beta hydrolase [Lachnospiraceae bacterium]|nr:alpha/beta hydrolase [Lachnospiraceae bacterium]
MQYGRINLHVDYEKAGVTPEETFHPYLDAYLLDDCMKPDSSEAPRDAVIVVPGGGYHMVSPREGDPIATQYLKEGCQAFVLHYSVEPAVFPMALLELALSVKTVRQHAEEWHIDPDRIFVIGFSAGGHLAASLSCFWHRGFIAEALDTTDDMIKPVGCILGYPVISNKVETHKGTFQNLLRGMSEEYYDLNSLETQVTGDVPPTFIWATMNDQAVPVVNSFTYAEALREAKVDTEVHIFRNGCHGLALATEQTAGDLDKYVEPHVARWIGLSVEWMKELPKKES